MSLRITKDESNEFSIASANEIVEQELAYLSEFTLSDTQRPSKFIFSMPHKVFTPMPLSWWESFFQVYARMGVNQTNMGYLVRERHGGKVIDGLAQKYGIDYDVYRNSLPTIIEGGNFDANTIEKDTEYYVNREISALTSSGGTRLYKVYKYLDESFLYRDTPSSRLLLPKEILISRFKDRGLTPEALQLESWDEAFIPLTNQIRPSDFLRFMTMSTLSQGAKYIVFWCYGPDYLTTEMNVTGRNVRFGCAFALWRHRVPKV
ncbi:MAG: hypothetical protein ACK5LK_03190 [Chthoniobacterales bacterium]